MDNSLVTLIVPLAIAILALIIEYWVIQPIKQRSRNNKTSLPNPVNSNISNSQPTKIKKSRGWLVGIALFTSCACIFGAVGVPLQWIKGELIAWAPVSVPVTPKPVQWRFINMPLVLNETILYELSVNNNLTEHFSSPIDQQLIIEVEPISKVQFEVFIYAYNEILEIRKSSVTGEVIEIEFQAIEGVSYRIIIVPSSAGGIRLSVNTK